MSDEGCFLDTTILAEALLKARQNRATARERIRDFKRSLLPVYAIKELQFGALKHYIWLHNKLVETRSLSHTIRAVHNAFHKPYQKGTAEEALQTGVETLVGSDFAAADTPEKTQAALADSVRLNIRRRINIAWRERRKLTTEVVDELSCYPEIAHFHNDDTGYIDNERRECDLSEECSLAFGFRLRRGELRKLASALRGSERREDQRRRKALVQLLDRRRRKIFGNDCCKALGDAYFALQCPTDCVILTSNAKDHSVLAGALGKKVHPYKPE